MTNTTAITAANGSGSRETSPATTSMAPMVQLKVFSSVT